MHVCAWASSRPGGSTICREVCATLYMHQFRSGEYCELALFRGTLYLVHLVDDLSCAPQLRCTELSGDHHCLLNSREIITVYHDYQTASLIDNHASSIPYVLYILVMIMKSVYEVAHMCAKRYADFDHGHGSNYYELLQVM